MFALIYNKEDGRVVDITNSNDSERLKDALPNTKDFIFADNLPEYDFYRQYLCIENGIVTVKNYELSVEQEVQIQKMEIIQEIDLYKQFLNNTDYKQAKWIDGDFTEEEYAPIRTQRKEARAKINELEEKLESM